MNKKLIRTNEDSMIAGVANGLAVYLNIDPVLVRLAFVLLALTHGWGIILYAILWMLMPEERIEEKIIVE